MTTYATDHRQALADIRRAGAAVTFSRDAVTLASATDIVTPTTTTVTGYAVRVPGDATRYARGGWTLSAMPTLLVACATYGDEPEAGDVVTWAGVVYTVLDVEPTAPDGSAIITSCVVGV